MSLTTYADLHAPASSDAVRAVYQLVGVRVHDTVKPMPPADRLTVGELASIDAWVAAGGPEGADPSCGGTLTHDTAPVGGADAVDSRWPSKCDEVYTIRAHGSGGEDTAYEVPGNAEAHPRIKVQAPWGDKPVQMIAMRAITDNPGVLHHWNLFGPRGEFVGNWSPGKDASTPLPPDVGVSMPAGTLTLDMHYNNLLSPKAQLDRSGLELCALTQPNFRKNTAALSQSFAQLQFSIPAHASDFAVTGTCVFGGSTPITLLSASPHAHALAKHMKFSVKKQSGEVLVMHDAPFHSEEQGTYALEPSVQVETGDTIITTCVYDNPGDLAVTFGENTKDEMCFNFAIYYPMGSLSCSGGR